MNNSIVTSFLKKLKSKQPKDYTLNELHDMAMDLTVIYEYSDDEEDNAHLYSAYTRIVDWINPKKAGYILNPSTLDNIDKRRAKK